MRIRTAQQDEQLSSVRLSGLDDLPTLNVSFDQAKLSALGLSTSAVDSTLTAAWGGRYVNDFIDRGRVKRVYVQGEAPFRSKPEDLDNWFVRSSSGQMTPFATAKASFEAQGSAFGGWKGWERAGIGRAGGRARGGRRAGCSRSVTCCRSAAGCDPLAPETGRRWSLSPGHYGCI